MGSPARRGRSVRTLHLLDYSTTEDVEKAELRCGCHHDQPDRGGPPRSPRILDTQSQSGVVRDFKLDWRALGHCFYVHQVLLHHARPRRLHRQVARLISRLLFPLTFIVGVVLLGTLIDGLSVQYIFSCDREMFEYQWYLVSALNLVLAILTIIFSTEMKRKMLKNA